MSEDACRPLRRVKTKARAVGIAAPAHALMRYGKARIAVGWKELGPRICAPEFAPVPAFLRRQMRERAYGTPRQPKRQRYRCERGVCDLPRTCTCPQKPLSRDRGETRNATRHPMPLTAGKWIAEPASVRDGWKNGPRTPFFQTDCGLTCSRRGRRRDGGDDVEPCPCLRQIRRRGAGRDGTSRNACRGRSWHSAFCVRAVPGACFC